MSILQIHASLGKLVFCNCTCNSKFMACGTLKSTEIGNTLVYA